jgi:hypothetical protein
MSTESGDKKLLGNFRKLIDEVSADPNELAPATCELPPATCELAPAVCKPAPGSR